MLIIGHPTGNANVRNALEAFRDAGILHRFFTTIDGSRLWLGNRRFPVKSSIIDSDPLPEIFRLGVSKTSFGRWIDAESCPFSVDGVYRNVDCRMAKFMLHTPKTVTKVYCYEDGGLEALRAAEKSDVISFYELPIAYGPWARERLRQEAERYPDWIGTLTGLYDSERKMERKFEEVQLANRIICPSEFVLKSIPEEIRPRAVIVRYGAADRLIAPQGEQRGMRDRKSPLRLLFVGSLSQRKGLADLFAAIKAFKPHQVSLTVVGSFIEPPEFYSRRCANATFTGPVSRAEVDRYMQDADLFVLPSIVEGRALVQLEALNNGLPIAISHNTGGEDLLESHNAGFRYSAGDVEGLSTIIAWCLANRVELEAMREEAFHCAQEVTWKHYRETLVREVTRIPGV